MNTLPTEIPADLAHALRAGIDAARAASSAAAHVSATVLIRAADGRGSIHQAWRGEGPDAWCQVASPGFRAHLLKTGHGDRAQIAFLSLTTDAYKRVRDRVLGLEECPHDLECECVDAPWPSVDDLRSRPDDMEIVTRDDEERGFARLSSGRIDLTLWDESVRLLFELIQLSRAVDRP